MKNRTRLRGKGRFKEMYVRKEVVIARKRKEQEIDRRKEKEN